MSKKDAAQSDPVIIKKYANRRLYNTESSSYVTLDDLAHLVKEGRDFVVRDAKSGEDLTHSVLTQIIFEQENRGQTLLSIPFLRQLISFYDDGLQAMVPGYLQSSMDAFTRNQEQLKKAFETSMRPGQAFAVFDEIARQNMALFERTIRMFTPFSGGEAGPADTETDGNAAGAESKIEALERQLADMQSQLTELRKK